MLSVEEWGRATVGPESDRHSPGSVLAGREGGHTATPDRYLAHRPVGLVVVAGAATRLV